MYNEDAIKAFNGLIIAEITGMVPGSDSVVIKTVCGRTFHMYHEQDCCENVRLVDVIGNPDDLIGLPIKMTEDTNSDIDPPKYPDSWTWTFYNFSTPKGYVTLRWLGESNGYYSESVTFAEAT